MHGKTFEFNLDLTICVVPCGLHDNIESFSGNVEVGSETKNDLDHHIYQIKKRNESRTLNDRNYSVAEPKTRFN